MKRWERPEISELEISATAHNWIGIYRDGGYIGDGEISGHLSWTKPECPGNGGGSKDEPSNPTTSLS